MSDRLPVDVYCGRCEAPAAMVLGDNGEWECAACGDAPWPSSMHEALATLATRLRDTEAALATERRAHEGVRNRADAVVEAASEALACDEYRLYWHVEGPLVTLGRRLEDLEHAVHVYRTRPTPSPDVGEVESDE